MRFIKHNRPYLCDTSYQETGGQPVFILQKYFLPKSKVKREEIKDKSEAPYDKWSKDGWLQTSEGATVDFHAVTEWFVHMVREYNIRPLWIGYDAALSGYWREEMEDYGFEMEKSDRVRLHGHTRLRKWRDCSRSTASGTKTIPCSGGVCQIPERNH